jgi:hypothetical protein
MWMNRKTHQVRILVAMIVNVMERGLALYGIGVKVKQEILNQNLNLSQSQNQSRNLNQ